MTERIRLNDGFDHLRDRIQDVEAAAEPSLDDGLLGYGIQPAESAPPAPAAAPPAEESARKVLEYIHQALLPESDAEPLVSVVLGMKAELARLREELEHWKLQYHLAHPRTGLTVEPFAQCAYCAAAEQALQQKG